MRTTITSNRAVELSVVVWLAASCFAVFAGETNFLAGNRGLPPAGASPARAASNSRTRLRLEQIPVSSISSLTPTLAETRTNPMVRIEGIVLDQALGEYVLVQDDSGSIRAETHETMLLNGGEPVSVWGRLHAEGNRTFLKGAQLQPAAWNSITNAKVFPAPGKPEQLPVLTRAHEIRDLPPAQAAWEYPVRLHAVLTSTRNDAKSIIVQDETAGIFVSLTQANTNLHVGDEVEVRGVSGPGHYAPVVASAQVTVLGQTNLPEPRQVTLYQMASGQFDSQWVEVHGVLRSVHPTRRYSELELADANGLIQVRVPDSGSMTNLVDSVVRVRGVCYSRANAKRQLTAAYIWVPATNYVVVEERGTVNPFELATQPIASLSEFTPRRAAQHRVKIAGIATFNDRGHLLFVQDETAGIPVYLASEAEPKPGDRVEVAGYLSPGNDFGYALRDAICRPAGSASLPAPKAVSDSAPLPGLHGAWVEMEARLVGYSRRADDDVMTLQSGGIIFEALRPVVGESRGAIRPPLGSLIRLRGVYCILADDARRPKAFRIYVPPTEAVSLLETPSWWNARHTWNVLGTMAVIILATMLWVIMLRRRIRQQTRAIEERERKFRLLVEQSLVGIYIIQDGRFAYVNPQLAAIFGYTTEELLQLPSVLQAVAERDRPVVEEQIHRRVDNQVNTVRYSFEGRRQDGTSVFVEVLGSRSEFNGKPAVLGMLLNITERKQAEAGLAEASSLLETLLENSQDLIYFKDQQSRFVRFSKAFAQFFKVKDAAELRGKTDFDFFLEEHARPAYEDEQEIIRTGKPILGKLEKETHADGRITWALTSKMPWRDKDGNIVGTFGISKNVTAIKEVEDKLAYERELFRVLVDNIPDRVYFKDLQSRFVRLSRSTVEQERNALVSKYRADHPEAAELPEYLTNLDKCGEYLIGKTDFDIYPEGFARVTFEHEQEIIRTGKPMIGFVEKMTAPDTGRITWYLTTKMSWRNQDGKTIGTFGVTRDITALKEAEAQLDSANKRVIETSRLAGMAEVATDVLHNVGNVLNSVNVSCSLTIDRIKASKVASLVKVNLLLEENRTRLGEFLTQDPRGQQIPNYIAALSTHLGEEQAAMLKELEQLLKHVDHIKQIVAMQQSYAKVAGVLESVNPTQLVDDALQINAAALSRHDVHLQCEYEQTAPITTEKHKVLQILVNLIRNAKYALDDAKRTDKLLRIKITRQDSGGVKIQVIDNGVGIPQENLTRIFSHGFTTRRNGHGFGLHSSALAVRDLGGTLSAHSDGPGKGATFTLTLPNRPPTKSEAPIV